MGRLERMNKKRMEKKRNKLDGRRRRGKCQDEEENMVKEQVRRGWKKEEEV